MYQCIGLFVLWKNTAEFTFFPIFMFSAPIVMDLVSTRLKGKLFKAMQIFFVCINVVLVIFCSAGISGLLVDSGANFAFADTSVVLQSVSFTKRFLVIPLLLDLIVPITMVYACPTKKMMETIKVSQRQRKGVNG